MFLFGSSSTKISFTKEVVISYLRRDKYGVYSDGYTVFISGMADDVDTWAADIVLEAADEVIIVSEKYSPSCFQKRNEWMVDHSSHLIAVCNDLHSGTANTIAYAEHIGKKYKKTNSINLSGR